MSPRFDRTLLQFRPDFDEPIDEGGRCRLQQMQWPRTHARPARSEGDNPRTRVPSTRDSHGTKMRLGRIAEPPSASRRLGLDPFPPPPPSSFPPPRATCGTRIPSG